MGGSSSDEEDDDSDALTDAVSKNLAEAGDQPNSDEENAEKRKGKDNHQRDLDVQR